MRHCALAPFCSRFFKLSFLLFFSKKNYWGADQKEIMGSALLKKRISIISALAPRVEVSRE
jgi:hypothetical protein